jgi:hypothetical protein
MIQKQIIAIKIKTPPRINKLNINRSIKPKTRQKN